MLVLSRREGQSIQLGDQIRITILQRRGRQVRIAIEAPREMRILRGELTPRAEGELLDGLRTTS